jgi:hypothetical protein
MPEISKELIELLSYLLPGFLVAWLFYALTSHEKPAQLERVIQALIFTLVVNGLVVLEKYLLLWLGSIVDLGVWTKESELIASIVTAIAFGLLAVYLVNTDILHEWLRDRNMSKQSSYPTEWCTTFSKNKSYVVLEMKDGRRLYGWPQIWPSSFEKGHLYMTEVSWIHSDPVVEMPNYSGVLIPVTDVQHVEFINTSS